MMEEKINRMFPWLMSVFKSSAPDALHSAAPKNDAVVESGSTSSSTVMSHFLKLSRDDRALLSIEIKLAWKYIEAIRNTFQILIEDFVETESSRVRLNVYIR